ncbi:MAG: M28 family peptidase, partial [Gemmatimonadales bacterium]
LLAVGYGCDSGVPTASDRPVGPLTDTALLMHLEFLADDSLYGRRGGSTYELQAAEYIKDEFADYGLEPGAPSYLQSFEFDIGAVLTSQNVIGMLPGRGSLAGQWVILGAHYDHLGFDQVSADSIVVFNGADDNASGTALMLEVARYLSAYFATGEERNRDRRSLMFQAYGAEELGLIGSWHFIENPTIPIDSLVAMVNLDMVGRLYSNALNVLGAQTSPTWQVIIADANDEGIALRYDNGPIGRSDHYPFSVLGEPVLAFFTGLHEDYHTPTDDDWLLDLNGMLTIGNLTIDVLTDLVLRPNRPQ